MNASNNLTFIMLTATLFFVAVAVMVIIFVIKAREKFYTKEIEHQNKIFAKILETQETERRRIAQELHDDIGSKLVALSLNLHLVQSDKTAEQEKAKCFRTIEQITNNTIETTRKISHTLFPPVLEKFSLNEAFEELINDFSDLKQVDILLKNEYDFKLFPKEKQLHVFRIVQELLGNSIKHGKAGHIAINFFENQTSIFCDYSDNGTGMSETEFKAGKGMGFLNIESRLTAIGGEYRINFKNQNGFNMIFSFPSV